MTSHEILGFMSARLSNQILEDVFAKDKALYRAILNAVAATRKVRPVFLEKQPRAQRHPHMIATLGRPAMEEVAGNLLRGWLFKEHKPLLTDFLDSLGIAHKEGVVEDLPPAMEDDKLKSGVEALLAKHSPEVVAVYLYAFNNMNDTRWENLDALLHKDTRLQLGG